MGKTNHGKCRKCAPHVVTIRTISRPDSRMHKRGIMTDDRLCCSNIAGATNANSAAKFFNWKSLLLNSGLNGQRRRALNCSRPTTETRHKFGQRSLLLKSFSTLRLGMLGMCGHMGGLLVNTQNAQHQRLCTPSYRLIL